MTFILACCHYRPIYHNPIDWNSYWAFGTMFFTGLLVLVAYLQLKASHKTQKADFAHRLKNDFFSPETSKLIMLFENKLIEFVDEQDMEAIPEGNPDDSAWDIYKIPSYVHFKVKVEVLEK